MKLGEVIVSVTPSPAPIAFARWVLPAPRSPHRQMTSPARATRPRATPRAVVVSGVGLVRRRSSWVAARMTGRSDEPFEVTERDSGVRAVGQPDDPGLEMDAAREATRADRRDELALASRHRARADAHEIDRRRRDHEIRPVEDQHRRGGGDRDPRAPPSRANGPGRARERAPGGAPGGG